MEHKGTVTLHTDRLVLRRLEVADSADMYKNWASDARVTKYMTWLPHQDVGVTVSLLREWANQYSDKSVYNWGIVTRRDHQLIGAISIVNIVDDINAVYVGYCLSYQHWYHGYASEALASVIEYLFVQVGVDNIFAEHDTNNVNSGKVMSKCGMLYQCTKLQSAVNNQGTVDMAVYSITRQQYMQNMGKQ